MNDITVEEIKSIRKSYGLSQRSFALLLGIGPASIVRYEQGSKPSKANANLIRAAKLPEFMKECLERDGDLISDQQRDKASEIVCAQISLDGPGERNRKPQARRTRGAAMNMSEMYELTLRQEILNEKAANIACDLMRIIVKEGIDCGDKTEPLPLLLTQLFACKEEIIGPNGDYPETLDGIDGYLRCIEDFMTNRAEATKVA